MTLIICPGVHAPVLSDRFCRALHKQLHQTKATTHGNHGQADCLQPYALLPTQEHAPFNGFAVWSYWQKVADPHQPLLLIAFSAGVVGAIAAAHLWQAQGRAIAALIAVDGWGMPQLGSFAFYRMSHDHFTHWSSALLGAGQDSFYADPAVDHLDLWQFPDRAQGLWVPAADQPSPPPTRTTAIEFITALLLRHGCQAHLTFRT